LEWEAEYPPDSGLGLAASRSPQHHVGDAYSTPTLSLVACIHKQALAFSARHKHESRKNIQLLKKKDDMFPRFMPQYARNIATEIKTRFLNTMLATHIQHPHYLW
jgi:hypothetical protein